MLLNLMKHIVAEIWLYLRAENYCGLADYSDDSLIRASIVRKSR